MRKPEFVFVALVLISVAAVVVGLIAHRLAGVFLYDSNFETFQARLDETQIRGMTASVQTFITIHDGLLVLTNLLWIAGSGYMLWRIRHNDRHQAEVADRNRPQATQ
jgi:hypothetical protein